MIRTKWANVRQCFNKKIMLRMMSVDGETKAGMKVLMNDESSDESGDESSVDCTPIVLDSSDW